jgi:alcohol dehydrogenase
MDDTGMMYSIFSEIEAEPNVTTIDRMAEAARGFKPDTIIGIGGGSVLDAAKAAAVLAANPGSVTDYLGLGNCPDTVLPSILAPTTSGTGSEVTPAAVYSQKQSDGSMAKTFIRDPKVYAAVAIVDPMLTVSVPPNGTAATGMDVLVHALESYTNVNANLLSEMLATRAIELVGDYLRRAVANGNDIEARYHMSLASTLAGMAFANTGTALIHGLSQALGAEFHVPHGLGNAIMAVPVTRLNYTASEEKHAVVAELLGENIEGLGRNDAAEMAVTAIETLVRDVGIPRKLSDLGIETTSEKIESLVRDAARITPFLFSNNCRQVTIEEASAAVLEVL